MHTMRFAAPILLTFILANAASAQFRPPVWPRHGQMKYFRVTITNQSDVTVIFTMHWEGKPADEVTLEPGQTIVPQTKQPPAPTKPELIVKYVPAPG